MLLLLSSTSCGVHQLKPDYSSFKSSTNFIKHNGLKKHLRRKPDLSHDQCEFCEKFFLNKMMKAFHTTNHCDQSIYNSSR